MLSLDELVLQLILLVVNLLIGLSLHRVLRSCEALLLDHASLSASDDHLRIGLLAHLSRHLLVANELLSLLALADEVHTLIRLLSSMNILVVSMLNRRLPAADGGLGLLHLLPIDEYLLLELWIICKALNLLDVAKLLLRPVGIVLAELPILLLLLLLLLLSDDVLNLTMLGHLLLLLHILTLHCRLILHLLRVLHTANHLDIDGAHLLLVHELLQCDLLLRILLPCELLSGFWLIWIRHFVETKTKNIWLLTGHGLKGF